jgi:sporulation protein YlmC with PRC-barrel domain
MTTTGRELYAALHLLDRQLIDRDGRFCGTVDDLELDATEEGTVYVTAIISGPGALWFRLGRRRLGSWLRRHVAAVAPTADEDASENDPDRIPMRHVSDIGAAIHLAADRYELGGGAGERWVRDHIIGHIPGSRHDADE